MYLLSSAALWGSLFCLCVHLNNRFRRPTRKHAVRKKVECKHMNSCVLVFVPRPGSISKRRSGNFEFCPRLTSRCQLSFQPTDVKIIKIDLLKTESMELSSETSPNDVLFSLMNEEENPVRGPTLSLVVRCWRQFGCFKSYREGTSYNGSTMFLDNVLPWKVYL